MRFKGLNRKKIIILVRELIVQSQIQGGQVFESIKEFVLSIIEFTFQKKESHRVYGETLKILLCLYSKYFPIKGCFLVLRIPMSSFLTFLKQIKKYCDSLHLLLYNEVVKPGNNSLIRGAGNCKVKQKIFGQFKIGQDTLIIISPFVNVFIINGLFVFKSLQSIANVLPE